MCREAVVRIAHEKAHELDRAGVGPGEEIDFTAQLRPVTMEDFWEARKKVMDGPRHERIHQCYVTLVFPSIQAP